MYNFLHLQEHQKLIDIINFHRQKKYLINLQKIYQKYFILLINVKDAPLFSEKTFIKIFKDL
jgi:hypothetical protein